MTLTQIDNEITTQLNLVEGMFTKENFKEVATFKLSDLNKKLKFADKDFKGLYYFEIKNTGDSKTDEEWTSKFIELWEDKKYKDKKVPLLYPGRYKKLTGNIEKGAWIPLYIGKSRKVQARVNQHIDLELTSSTYAMKLKAHTELANETFRVSVLKVEVDNYDAIVPFIEKTLRSKIDPIIGKQ